MIAHNRCGALTQLPLSYQNIRDAIMRNRFVASESTNPRPDHELMLPPPCILVPRALRFICQWTRRFSTQASSTCWPLGSVSVDLWALVTDASPVSLTRARISDRLIARSRWEQTSQMYRRTKNLGTKKVKCRSCASEPLAYQYWMNWACVCVARAASVTWASCDQRRTLA